MGDPLHQHGFALVREPGLLRTLDDGEVRGMRRRPALILMACPLWLEIQATPSLLRLMHPWARVLTWVWGAQRSSLSYKPV